MTTPTTRPSVADPTEAAEVVEPVTGSAPSDPDRTPRWLYGVLGGGLFLMVVPFVWMLLSSVKPEGEVRRVPPTWRPGANACLSWTPCGRCSSTRGTTTTSRSA